MGFDMRALLFRLSWLLLPLLTVAVVSAPEWPARTQMLEGASRDVWFPLAQRWADLVAPAPAAVDRAIPVPSLPQAPVALPAPGPAVATVVAAVQAPAAPAVALASSAPTPIEPVAAATGGTVLMLGDSLMGGVVVGLRQRLPRQFKVVDRHKASTGLSNQEYFDWPTVAGQAALETQPQWVVIHLGGNDGQDILRQGKWLRFGSPEWKQEYQARAERMIAQVRAASPHAQVVWLGLPAMRPEKYENKSVLIASLHRAASYNQGVTYVDGRQALGGTYTKDGQGYDGRRQVWRLDDGIHYSRAGGVELGNAVGVTMGWSMSP